VTEAIDLRSNHMIVRRSVAAGYVACARWRLQCYENKVWRTVPTPLHLELVLHAPFGLGHGLDGDVDEQHA
jgi:hypothetical protein